MLGGAYGHSALVPAGTELILLSGPVGVRPDRSVPNSIAEQAEQVFANIGALLAAHGLDASALVKFTMFVVAGQDIQAVRAARAKFVGAPAGIDRRVRIAARRPRVEGRGRSGSAWNKGAVQAVQFLTTRSISTAAPRGKAATPMVVRAGNGFSKCLA